MIRAKLYKDFNGADLIEATNYDLHTGRLLGLPNKIISLLAALVAASLPITGFIIWWKKRKQHKKNHKIFNIDSAYV
ncbi:PepSY domain-containing protein [Pedobacter sp. P26]|uniref:PepSY domain-containing protein n=1 Tax=Pedobacter sp. P26 TaxID=3423956 RepID=UPI003D669E6A